ncbi:MAG: glycosyltransferase family 1 protein [Armatimonadetes bacterium]|nr:glycosyltransferase family 1 protein [Armatimonadota bacterium]
MSTLRSTENVRLAVDTRMLYSSGIGMYLRNLVPLLVKLLPDARFHLLGNTDMLGRYAWAHRPNVSLHDCRSPIYSVSEQFEIPAKVPRGVDLLWSPHYNIPLLYRGRLVVTLHDAFHLAMPEYVGGLHKRLYAKAMFSALRRKAQTIMCVSRFTADELTRLTRGDRQQLRVVYNGVSEGWFNVRKGESPHNKPYLLCVGNVKPNKNLVALVEAFGLIAGKVQHDLVIVGKKEGFITGDDRVAAKAASLGERVTFTGYVEDDLLRRYYANAACFIFPSFYEGFGLPPLEAMACGCPVIVSNAASLPEVCGDAALYCDPHSPEDIADKITLLMSDDALRGKLRHAGFERAAMYSWDNCARLTVKVLEEALAQ